MEYWSITEGVFNCLIDRKRTEAFSSAIKNTIKSGDVVVDMGTGSGILAMVAARAGASRVYAVEIDRNNILTLNKVFEKNNLSHIIKVIEGDVTEISLPEKVDVIIGEMIATGLIEELQVPAMNNMLRFAKDNVKVLLNKYDTYVDVVYNNNKYNGFTFDIFRYEYDNDDELVSKSVTDKHLISSVDFSKFINDININFSKEISIKEDGLINGLRISSQTIFSDNSEFGYSFAYSYPIILPIDEKKVFKGDKVVIDICYKLCGGINNFSYTIKYV